MFHSFKYGRNTWGYSDCVALVLQASHSSVTVATIVIKIGPKIR
jgi:hypothetical protein